MTSRRHCSSSILSSLHRNFAQTNRRAKPPSIVSYQGKPTSVDNLLSSHQRTSPSTCLELNGIVQPTALIIGPTGKQPDGCVSDRPVTNFKNIPNVHFPDIQQSVVEEFGSNQHYALILRLHGQFCVVSLPYMDNEWSVSERDLLSQCPERANAVATSTGRRLVMKCTWSRSRGTRLAPSTASIQ